MVYAQIAADGQVEGEIAVGLGYALSGEILWEKEKVFSLDYRVPTGADMPAIKTIMVETDEPNTPFGNKVQGIARHYHVCHLAGQCYLQRRRDQGKQVAHSAR